MIVKESSYNKKKKRFFAETSNLLVLIDQNIQYGNESSKSKMFINEIDCLKQIKDKIYGYE